MALINIRKTESTVRPQKGRGSAWESLGQQQVGSLHKVTKLKSENYDENKKNDCIFFAAVFMIKGLGLRLFRNRIPKFEKLKPETLHRWVEGVGS